MILSMVHSVPDVDISRKRAAPVPLHPAGTIAASVRERIGEVLKMVETTQETLQRRALLNAKKKAERARDDGLLRAEWIKRRLLRSKTDVMFNAVLHELHEQLDKNEQLEHAFLMAECNLNALRDPAYLMADRKLQEWDGVKGA